MTDPAASAMRFLRIDTRVAGGVLYAAGLALLTPRPLLAAALGLELLAAAFWLWARASADAREQVPRWAWLRRPATALWLAVAIHAVLPADRGTAVARARDRHRRAPALARGDRGGVGRSRAAGGAAAGAARSPICRGRCSWCARGCRSLLPAAGFVILWRQSMHWTEVEPVRHAAVPLLLLTAVLAALRAFARRAVDREPALARRLRQRARRAARGVRRGAASGRRLLLWLGALRRPRDPARGRAARRGDPRRGVVITRLWRAAAWTALAALSWPRRCSPPVSAGGGRHCTCSTSSVPRAPPRSRPGSRSRRMQVAPERRR